MACQAVGETDLHTLATAEAAGEKLGFVLGPGGADEILIRPPGQGAQAQHRRDRGPGRHRSDQLAPPQIQGNPGRPGTPGELHPAFLALSQAAHTELALGVLMAGGQARSKGAHLASLGAVAAIGAQGRGPPAQPGKTGQQTVERSQRAQGPAPEAPVHPLGGHHQGKER